MANKHTAAHTLRLAQLGVLSGLILLMTFVPFTGYISYGVLSITLIHIPVLIGAVVMGPGAGAILGGVWGVSCIVKALIAPPSPLEGLIFWNPLVALLPRVLAGLAAGWVFRLAARAGGKWEHIAAGAAAALGAVTNTVLVMGAIYLLYGTKLGPELGVNLVTFGGLLRYILAAFGLNGVLEIAVGIVLTVPVSAALRKIRVRAI